MSKACEDVPHRLSIMVPCYRPTVLLKETLVSALVSLRRISAEVQIEIVDDASPDVDVSTLVESWDLPQVRVYRRETNGGLATCWNTCIERASGEFIHVLHQDDLVKPDFYLRLHNLFVRYPSAGMAFCRAEFLQQNMTTSEEPVEQQQEGILVDWLERICQRQRLQCPSVIVRKSTYQTVGGFDEKLKYVVDWEMWVRIAAHFPVAYTPHILSSYRCHEGSETARLKRSGLICQDAKRAYDNMKLRLHGPQFKQHRTHLLEYLLLISSGAVSSAVANGELKLARRELQRLIGCWGTCMPLAQLVRHLKWYFNLTLRLATTAGKCDLQSDTIPKKM
jgi:GT2 family glycosyltransferase